MVVPLILFANHILKASGGEGNAMLFQRTAEPKENAFTFLVPKGWIVEGGIFRLDPSSAGGAANAITAKCDLAVKKDRAGSVMIRWLPDLLYMDITNAPAAAFFPPGSNYNGMRVIQKLTPEQFIEGVLFPQLHPGARNVSVVERHRLDELAARYQKQARVAMPGSTMSYAAAAILVGYEEEGQVFREMVVTLIEDFGSMGAGLWSNKETFLFRAPEVEFIRWLPVLSTIQESVRFNGPWLVNEIRGQQTRSGIMIETQNQIQQIDQAMVDHRQQTNAEIHHDVFLTLTGQEEYVNPFTKEVEVGSNEWQYRWINEQGDVIYTDREAYDPNADVELHITGFKRTPVRKRSGG